MSLPVGLLPVFAFVLTVGVSVPATLGAHLALRAGGSFGSALRGALVEAGLLYLVGVGVIHFVAGGGSLWGGTTMLVVVGLAAAVVLVALPLAVGRWVVGRVRNLGPDEALRFAAYGWPVAAAAVFGVFVAPAGPGPAGGHLLSLGGPTTCLAGFCGVPVSLAAAAALELLVALVGPGVVGAAVHASVARTRRAARS
ncbi:hypothetical protein [Candidatus Halobonum tyrrellensis]|uniref:Uncharacterized protein n=1 Tax=Candidatus Halobonum tyrrellensis G22 TaxID=1324957 RepID=V4HJ59_9EURY|nr:hypothetical protein [Candidatus Halobonum tyrrellensis]ESP87959.1 hypothetical protein K933_11601 [Candidatus Halobonum tyrrellensis G22]